METWQRNRDVCCGASRCDSAGAKGNADLLSRMDMIVAAGAASATQCRCGDSFRPAEGANRAHSSTGCDLRPTLFLAQLSKSSSRQHLDPCMAVTGSSRTFSWRGIGRRRPVPHCAARIAAGQATSADRPAPYKR